MFVSLFLFLSSSVCFSPCFCVYHSLCVFLPLSLTLSLYLPLPFPFVPRLIPLCTESPSSGMQSTHHQYSPGPSHHHFSPVQPDSLITCLPTSILASLPSILHLLPKKANVLKCKSNHDTTLLKNRDKNKAPLHSLQGCSQSPTIHAPTPNPCSPASLVFQFLKESSSFPLQDLCSCSFLPLRCCPHSLLSSLPAYPSFN